MKVSVREASRQYGVPFPFTLEETVEDFTYGGLTVSLAGPAKLAGTVTGDGKAFTVEAEGQVVLRGNCDRCLEPYEQPLAFSLSERFVRENAEEEEAYPYCGDELELDRPFLDNMLLSMPIIHLCREDCRGLCPVCGMNLNKGVCQCARTEKKSAFDILRTMSFDNKEV